MEYIYNFNQQKMFDLGLDCADVLLLNYLVMFFSSGKNKGERVDGKFYGWITYNKIATDMKILRLGERQLKRLTKKYEELGIIEKRHGEFKRLMIYINQDTICGMSEPKTQNATDSTQNKSVTTGTIKTQIVDNLPQKETEKVVHDTTSCRPCPPIDNNDINKINIILTNTHTRALSDFQDLIKINEIFYGKLKTKVSSEVFMFYFLPCRITAVLPKQVELTINPDRKQKIMQFFFKQLETAVHETIFEINKK